MTFDSICALLILIGSLALLVADRLPTGITGLIMMLALVLCGVLEPHDAFQGLVDPAVLAIAGMFVISAGIQRTGAIGYVANRFTTRGRQGSTRSYVLLLLVVMVLSAFMNNTPLVLVFLPVVLGLATRMGEPPSRLLIPLSFISIFGGMCTLVGTSTNLVVRGTLLNVSSGELDLGMFTFAKLGVILAVAGTLFVLAFRKRLLPDRVSLGLLSGKGIATEYMTEIEIPAGSRFVGQRIADAFQIEGESGTVRILQLIRHQVIRPAKPDSILEADDVLLLKGDAVAVVDARRRAGSDQDSEVEAPAADGDQRVRGMEQTLFEVVVPPNSRYLGRRIKDVRFTERFDARIFALQRHGEHHRRTVEEMRLRAGDVLLVQGPTQSIQNLHGTPDLIVVEGVHEAIPHTQRAPLALIATLVFVALAITGLQEIHVAALIAAVIMVLGRCLSVGEAYASLAWDVLLLIAGTLAIATAFRETGLAAQSADWIATICGPFGVRASIGGMFLFTALLTQIISNTAAAALMTPLAYATGNAIEGATPMPMVMAVAFGASCAFLTPVAYQTNLLVYGPGGYRFTDFIKLGLPLTVLFAVIATALLPVLY